MKRKEITIQLPNGQTVTQKVGMDHPAYQGADIVFLASKNVEGVGRVIDRRSV